MSGETIASMRTGPNRQVAATLLLLVASVAHFITGQPLGGWMFAFLAVAIATRIPRARSERMAKAADAMAWIALAVVGVVLVLWGAEVYTTL